MPGPVKLGISASSVNGDLEARAPLVGGWEPIDAHPTPSRPGIARGGPAAPFKAVGSSKLSAALVEATEVASGSVPSGSTLAM